MSNTPAPACFLKQESCTDLRTHDAGAGATPVAAPCRCLARDCTRASGRAPNDRRARRGPDWDLAMVVVPRECRPPACTAAGLRGGDGPGLLAVNQCGWRDSNPHALRHQILSLARLPVPPHPRVKGFQYTKCAPLPPPHIRSPHSVTNLAVPFVPPPHRLITPVDLAAPNPTFHPTPSHRDLTVPGPDRPSFGGSGDGFRAEWPCPRREASTPRAVSTRRMPPDDTPWPESNRGGGAWRCASVVQECREPGKCTDVFDRSAGKSVYLRSPEIRPRVAGAARFQPYKPSGSPQHPL